MSSMFNDRNHPNYPKREPNENSGADVGILYPSPPSLKLNKVSHVIKKPHSPPSSSSSAVAAVGKPRHPVIIYTHTPKIIHTNPKDFMALVQKLTGISRSDEDSDGNATPNREGESTDGNGSDLSVDRKINRNRSGSTGGHNNYHKSYSGTGAGNGNGKGIFFSNAMNTEDSESSSVITTDENIGEHGQVPYSAVDISPPAPPPSSMYDATGINYGAYFSTYPIFPPVDNFLDGNQPFANFDDPLIFPHSYSTGSMF